MALGDDLKNSKEILEGINKSAVEFESTLNAIQQALKNAAKEEQDLASIIKVAEDNTKNLNREAKRLSRIKADDLKTEASQKKFTRDKLKFERELQRTKSIQSVLQDRLVNATKEEAEGINRIDELMLDVAISSKTISDNFEEISDATQKINRAAKGFESMADTLGSIPGIGPPLSKAFKGAAQAARDATAAGKGFGASLREGMMSLFSLKAILLSSVGFLFEADKRTTELAKSLQISKDEAREINEEFINISINSGKAFINQRNLQEATTELSQQLRVANRLNNDLVENQAFLTKQLGLSADSAAELARYSVFTGKSAEETNEEIADQVANLQKETGIALKLNDVFDEVNKANAGLKAAYGFNNKLIAEQVILTKQLGLSLDQTTKIASQLLDFESSIAKELEAELLTGKDLNLEKARLLALQGKNTEAAAELAKQVGGTAELSRMHVLQQEALAEAMGMERNELIQSVQQREILSRLGEKSIADAAKTEEGRRRIVELGGEQLLQQYEQESAAARFESAVIKIQEALATMMEGPLGSVINGLATAASSAGTLYTVMGALGAMSMGRLLAQVASLVAANSASAAAALTTASALTFGLGLIAILGAVGVGLATMNSEAQKSAQQMTQVQDAMINPAGGLVVSGPKGSFQLDGEDSIIAGTSLVGNGGNNNNSSQMMEEQKRTNNFLERLLAKDNSPKVEISAIPGVSYEQRQANNMNTYTTNVA